MSDKTLIQKLQELAEAQAELDRREQEAKTCDEKLAIAQETVALMGRMNDLVQEAMTPDQRATAERYRTMVSEPMGRVFGEELQDILDEHGTTPMIRAAKAVLKDLQAHMEHVFTKVDPKGGTSK